MKLLRVLTPVKYLSLFHSNRISPILRFDEGLFVIEMSNIEEQDATSRLRFVWPSTSFIFTLNIAECL